MGYGSWGQKEIQLSDFHFHFDHFDAFSDVEFREFWMSRGIVQYQKNFKRQSRISRVLPDFRENALIEPILKRFLTVQVLLYN